MNNSIRIIIAGFHRLVRDALALAIEQSTKKELLVTGHVQNIESCIKLVKEEAADVVITDSDINKYDSERLIGVCRESDRTVKLIVLIDSITKMYYNTEILKGINGLIQKDSTLTVLIDVIKKVCSGEDYIDPKVFEIINNNDEKTDEDKKVNIDEILTRREIEILKLLTTGLFNKEIAFKLSISEKTVKNHISNIFKKTGVSDRTQAAVYAIKNGLVSV